MWEDLQARVRECDTLTSGAIDGKALALEERMTRMAAVDCAQKRQPMMSLEETLRLLAIRLDRLHDPLRWQLDVKKRLKAIELGDW